MKQSQNIEMPRLDESTSNSSTQKRYFTAEEAMAYMEPRIRSMFQ
ncbi:MAG: hypothetical protein SOT07_07285 [Paludibacteraceae bacterium]|nr:hypothetical protein [Paludibacteraceae bacterium]